MPITEMTLDGGIFYVREEGEITKEDAVDYTMELISHCEQQPSPIVILIDAMDVTSVSMDARKIFARVTSDQNHDQAYVACGSLNIVQAARVIGLMSKDRKTHVYRSLETARDHATQRVEQLGKACDN